MVFHHHPDNLIFVRGENATYSDTPENFATDLGVSYSFDGRERLYQPGIRHFIDNEPQPLEWPEGDAYIAALDDLLAAQDARLNPPLALEQIRQIGLEQINNIVTNLQAQLWPEAKREIYRQKQIDILLWQLSGTGDLPQSVIFEWENDWAGRLNEEGYVLAEGPGVIIECRTAADLFGVWRVNAAFVDYTRIQMEPGRTRTQATVETAKNEAEITSAITQFAAMIQALPVTFISEQLPGLLTEYKLTVSS